MNKNEFMRGRIEVPWPLSGDAYTVAGACLASPEALEKSAYNFTNRYSPKKAFPDVAKDSRMVLYGLTDFIRNHLTRRVTLEQIENANKFMSTAHSFGGPLKFDRTIWERVVKEYDGYLPIKIEALQEGLTFFPNEPVIQVTSLGSGFGEIAALIEAIMVGMVSIATARVTLTRHWYERIKEWCYVDNNMEMSQFMVHDFGMRASSCAEESELLGKAHLLVFHGTDTFNAAYQARMLGAKEPTGTSILALAHRIVQGYDTENEAYENLLKQDKIGSYVADCYNYKNAVKNILIPLCKSNPNNIVVARPDSGDYIDNDNYARNQALENGLVVDDETQHEYNITMYKPSNFTTINGDSMTPRKTELLFRERNAKGFTPTKWGIVGVGGYLRNTPNRDVLSSAYKLCAKGKELTPVIKLSDTPSKMSVPGPTALRRYNNNDKLQTTVFMQSEYHIFGENAYVTYYDGGLSGEDKFGDECLVPFSTIQERTINDFNRYERFSKKYSDFGLITQSCLSKNIQDMQKAMLRKHQ